MKCRGKRSVGAGGSNAAGSATGSGVVGATAIAFGAGDGQQLATATTAAIHPRRIIARLYYFDTARSVRRGRVRARPCRGSNPPAGRRVDQDHHLAAVIRKRAIDQKTV